MITDLKRMIETVSREKGVEKDVLVQALEEAVKAAARKTFGAERDLEVSFNDELGEIEVFEFKEVVSEVADEHLQVSLEEARDLDPESELGDSLGMKMDMGSFGRIAAQSAKQVIMQRLKEAERDIVFDDFKDRRGEIINGIVQRFDKGAIIVNLGRTEAELPGREQIPRESYRQGDRIRAYILDVKQFSRGPQIILSRTHPNFLSALFETEVPEISEGIVQIVQVAREPGSRAKIAVSSKESDVDPVGACVGVKGSRVQAVVQELRGEKIDIVTWDPDPAKFICNALAPAEIVRVIMDETNQSMEVVVPDDQLSLAIGKRGQNVRLASRLTGWKLDVTSETHYNDALKENYMSLLSVEGVGEKLAGNLFEEGFRSAGDLAEATVEELMSMGDISEEDAEAIIQSAKEYTPEKNDASEEEATQESEDTVAEDDREEQQADEEPQADGETKE
ncbi:MAG: transcription termination/antitermination protein NusA [Deltaproteobacteria bacterium]|nr:MAG: transcription termination/antitermination protein NusA [Desulfobacteraceae bacterium 4484_190.3]RLB17474.1 MAG: transcription termination/antitermination protein NusA [Deltaproteobacteria bacterium]